LDAYIGLVLLAGFNFPPLGWLPCDGRLLPISGYDALFSLIGTTYGGDGQTTFALPDLQGRATVGSGQLQGGGNYSIGERGGAEQVTLLTQQYPAHTHPLKASVNGGTTGAPGNAVLASGVSAYANASNLPVTLNPAAIAPSFGRSLPHENLQPYLGMNWIICVDGIYPPRN
jgi:microcystin-dependent protein